MHSEVGVGTSFRIYFPAARDAETAAVPPPAPDRPRGGVETILVVEDQPDVRSVTRAVLARYGYTVLEAASGGEALRLAQQFPSQIDLLLTDVVMPAMSGPELAARLEGVRPAIRVLYASGCTEDGVVRRGALEPGVSFIQKPFTPSALLTKVRDGIDGCATRVP